MQGWPVGHVYVPVTENGNELAPTKIWHLDDPERYRVFREATERTHFVVGEGLPRRVLESGAPAWIANVQTDSNFPRNRLVRDLGVRGAVSLPVKIRREVVAVLEFFSDSELQGDDHLVQLMRSVSEQLGRVFERKRAGEELQLAQAAAEAANEAKGSFLVNMSHSETSGWTFGDPTVVMLDTQTMTPNIVQLNAVTL